MTPEQTANLRLVADPYLAQQDANARLDAAVADAKRKRPSAYTLGTIAREDGTRAPAVRWRRGTVDWQDDKGDWRIAHPSLADTFEEGTP
jgi:hypothetical protein